MHACRSSLCTSLQQHQHNTVIEDCSIGNSNTSRPQKRPTSSNGSSNISPLSPSIGSARRGRSSCCICTAIVRTLVVLLLQKGTAVVAAAASVAVRRWEQQHAGPPRGCLVGQVPCCIRLQSQLQRQRKHQKRPAKVPTSARIAASGSSSSTRCLGSTTNTNSYSKSNTRNINSLAVPSSSRHQHSSWDNDSGH